MLAGTTNQLGMDLPIFPQSGFSVATQTMQFNDATRDSEVSIPSFVDETRNINDSNDSDLGNFFSRPVKVFEDVWTIGTHHQHRFNPWKLFFENKRVSNRITNFNLLRCKLKIKFLVNGNPFFYGRMLVAYLPFGARDELTTNLDPEDCVHLSQCPRLFIDPTTSLSGTMHLPFFWDKDYLDIPNGDWDEMGDILLNTITLLKHANGNNVGDLVTLTAYAWAEEVQLAGPTNVNSAGITPQSGSDEYVEQDGTISRPASALAKMANGFVSAPIIGPYALATKIAASAIANVAQLFGYSRPVLTAPPIPYRPTPIGDLATTNTADNSKKLTVDVKQELTIDPRITGLGPQDELDLSYLAQKESYWTSFTWNQATPPDTHLWNCVVDPCVWVQKNVALQENYYFPATAFVSMPFKYWSGSLNYRFQVVASAMHKGRLAIQYDPVTTPLTREDNVNYVEIIDIATCREFTVTVPNNQPYTLLPRASPSEQVSDLFLSSVVPFDVPRSFGNGTLSVWVINDLTTPTTDPLVDNSIQINVFISAAPDFEVHVPDASDYSKFVVQPQSGMETTDVASDTAVPYKSPDTVVGDSANISPAKNVVYTGEVITSFRQMLRRYEYHSRQTTDGISFTDMLLSFCAFPYLRGGVPSAVNATPSGPYNFSNTTLLHWVTLGFQGHRGSMRWKLIPGGIFGSLGTSICTTRTTRTPSNKYSKVTVGTPSNAAPSIAARYGLLTNILTMDGSSLTSWVQNPNEEVEIPFYSPYRFAAGKITDYTNGTSPYNGLSAQLSFPSQSGNNKSWVDLYSATGEDFNAYFFTGLPILYREATLPDASPS